MGLIQRLLGIDQVLAEVHAQREAQQQLLREVVRTTQLQTEAAVKMASAFERIAVLTEVSGPPGGRHFSDEIEADLWEQMNYDS